MNMFVKQFYKLKHKKMIKLVFLKIGKTKL